MNLGILNYHAYYTSVTLIEPLQIYKRLLAYQAAMHCMLFRVLLELIFKSPDFFLERWDSNGLGSLECIIYAQHGDVIILSFSIS